MCAALRDACLPAHTLHAALRHAPCPCLLQAILLPFRCSSNCVPEEIVLKALQPGRA